GVRGYRRQAADGIAARIPDGNAGAAVSQVQRAPQVGADGVAGDDVVRHPVGPGQRGDFRIGQGAAVEVDLVEQAVELAVEERLPRSPPEHVGVPVVDREAGGRGRLQVAVDVQLHRGAVVGAGDVVPLARDNGRARDDWDLPAVRRAEDELKAIDAVDTQLLQ